MQSISIEKHLPPFGKPEEKSSGDAKLTYVPLSQLKTGLNEDKMVVGVVVCSVQNEELVPL